jgi:hypothetical protein
MTQWVGIILMIVIILLLFLVLWGIWWLVNSYKTSQNNFNEYKENLRYLTALIIGRENYHPNDCHPPCPPPCPPAPCPYPPYPRPPCPPPPCEESCGPRKWW